ncbi:MAG: zinc ribbon domain-containing protein [Acidobacteriaceae bacterium]|nr:zinc ribbon domain-containing protein [Acidobacteriaceae bacterium]MBV9675331.1 zinc ribbon domain-containing protein [Acidobacteriaceae bacterium]MBV9938200.1 zinc ribbon domain-containing protein [Acidobacteriaceae bacterium]
MQPRCTCGAILPDDARFCHKCGKPQFEEDAARISLQQASDTVQVPSEPATVSGTATTGISFKNSRAVVISLIAAVGAMVGFLPVAYLAPALFPLLLCAMGFVAVRIYKSSSAEPMTVSAGARLGWMTGLWLFAIFAVLLALGAIMFMNPQVWQQFQEAAARTPQAAAVSSMSQHEAMVQLLIAFPFCFFLFTLLSGLGGMLGAKLPLRKRAS